MILRRIGVISTAGVFALFMSFLGFIIGSIMSLVVWIMDGSSIFLLQSTPLSGIIGVIALPFLMAAGCLIIGFNIGLLTAALFNLALKIAMGIEVIFED